MILVTGTEVFSNLELLSGILLEPITEADFTKDVFNAFLVSDRVREVVCELPIQTGGIGTTTEGRLVSELNSKLRGLIQHAYAPGSKTVESIVRDIIENRVKLVTTSEIRGVVYPAFLSSERTSPPVRTEAVVALELERIGDLPEMQAFAVEEQNITNEREWREPVSVGTMLPVTCISAGRPTLAAMKIVTRISSNEFETVIYHEASTWQPSNGDVLERRVTLRNRRNWVNPKELLEFSARVGIVRKVQN